MMSIKKEPALWRFERLLNELERLMQENVRLSNQEISVLLGVPEVYARQLAKALIAKKPGKYRYRDAGIERI